MSDLASLAAHGSRAVRDLSALFDPSAVALVGASNDSDKWGYWLARGLTRGEHRRAVYLVNRRGGEILARPAYRSLLDIPARPELAVIAVPASALEAAVEEAIGVGARALVCITAGLAEAGDDGLARERDLVQRVRRSGGVLLGPNCIGVVDNHSELWAAPWARLPVGSIGLVSQSGNLVFELGRTAARARLGFSRFVSLGNQADIAAVEVMGALEEHAQTGLVALYLEDFGDGRAFVAACERLVGAGKPVLVLAGGGSAAGVRAARSHTGALATDARVVRAACRDAGAIVVDTPAELIACAQMALSRACPAGRRVAVLGDGGGHGVIAADELARSGLEVPPLEDAPRQRLAALLGTSVSGNPIDLAGALDVRTFEQAAEILYRSPQVDAVLLTGCFGFWVEYDEKYAEVEVAVAHRLAELARSSRRPLLVHTPFIDSPAAAALRAEAVPVYEDISAAARSLARWLAAHEAPRRSLPELPAPRDPAIASGERSPRRATIASDDYFAARGLVEQAGIPMPEARRVATLTAALDAADEIGYPVALKALGRVHKSDGGGVVLGLRDEAELRRAWEEIARRIGPRWVSVEQMAGDGGIELIIGYRVDPKFGPVALVGLGGIYAEALDDTALALAPIDLETADRLLRSFRGARLLGGARGGALDLPSVGRALVGLTRVGVETAGVAELEVNPLLVSPGGVCALDARVVLASAE